MSLFPYLLAIAALYGLLLLVVYFTVWRRLLKNPLQHPSHTEIPAEFVPASIQGMFQVPVGVLKALGFQSCGYFQTEPMFKVGDHKKWMVLLYHSIHKTYAGVEIRHLAEPLYPFDTDFYTFFKDRTLLLTMNGQKHALPGEIPNTVVQDFYTPLLANQWQAHLEQLEQLKDNRQPCGLALADFLIALQQHYQSYLDALLNANKVVPVPGTAQFRMHWAFALQLALKLVTGNHQVARLVQQRRNLVNTGVTQAVDIPLELEAEGFQYVQQMDQGQAQRKMGIWILLGSMALAAASFTSVVSGKTLLILIAVLLLHELGHFLAMRLCGYQDTSIFFLPFFGAAAIGQKHNATLTEKVWVLLAGPMPGLLLGVGLLFLNGNNSYSDWLGEASIMLIVLNLFNLLPIYPLDGGKIVNLLWFSRYPYTDLLFKGFAVAVLVWLGLSTPVMLAIALMVACTIPLGFRSAKVDTQLRKDLSHPAHTVRDNLLPTIFQAIRETGYGKLPIAQRHNLAKDLLQRHWESHARWTTRIALSALYSVSLLAGVVGVPLTFLHTAGIELTTAGFFPRQARKHYQKALDQANQAVQQNPENAQAYLRRARIYTLMQEYSLALVDYDQAIRLKPKEVKIYLDRAKLYAVMQNHQSMIADANRALQLDPKSIEAYGLRGSARQMMGDRQGAIADQKQAETLAKQRHLTQARRELTQVNQQLRRDPRNVAAYLKRADIRLELGDSRGALRDCNQAIRLNPRNAEAYLNRASIYYQLESYKTALADTNRALSLNSKFAEAYGLRSSIRQELGDEVGATADAEQVERFH
jgi:cytochrome c-type biogenesis protein CcmH/NrfG/Zn-dependent protease